jgi:predicted Zn-dependent protease
MDTIDIIKQVIKELGIDEWIIREKTESSLETFFIRKELDMRRAKNIKKYKITLYRLFEMNRKTCKGSATITLPSQISRSEIISRLEKAWYAASFVMNKPYPMAEPIKTDLEISKSQLEAGETDSLMEELRYNLYKNDTHQEGGINSAEIFLNQYHYHLLSSSGIDQKYARDKGYIELICDWKENHQDIELYNMFSFAKTDSDFIAKEYQTQIENCRLRSQAQNAPNLKGINIILTLEAVREIMNFYYIQSSAKGVYEKITRGKKGELFQGEKCQGDLINITLDPFLEGSPDSVPFDDEGTALKKTVIFKEGRLLRYHGNQQYSHYLKVKPTGLIKNLTVEAGTSSKKDWMKEPYVEIRNFSDFQMDPMTGDFGGEVRLALWFDGTKTVPLTGASLSTCLFDVQKEFYLSKERIQRGNYFGPAFLMFPDGSLAGE